jgi:hypothetical protein
VSPLERGALIDGQECECVQGSPIYGGGYPLGGALVSAVSGQLQGRGAHVADRGVSVDHTTVSRWTQRYAPEIEKRVRPHLRTTNGSWRVDETYVKVKGRCRVNGIRQATLLGRFPKPRRRRDTARPCHQDIGPRAFFRSLRLPARLEHGAAEAPLHSPRRHKPQGCCFLQGPVQDSELTRVNALHDRKWGTPASIWSHGSEAFRPVWNAAWISGSSLPKS